jgi:hypothetical protein
VADEDTNNGPDEGQQQQQDTGKPGGASDEGGQSKPDEGEDDLGAAKRRARHFEAELKKATKRQSEIESELEKFREASKTEQEKAIDRARREGAEEATKEWKPRHEGLIRRNAALQLLGGRVKAPALVLPHLGLDDIEINSNGEVDETALKLAIERVLEEYPFLAQDDSGSTTSTTHHGDLGARRNSKSGKHDPDELLRAAFRR